MADSAMKRVVTLFTTLFLRLRNGALVEAAPLALGEYIVKGEGDNVHLVNIDQVGSITVDGSGGSQIMFTQSGSEEQTEKGGVVNTIYHFMRRDGLGLLTRVITNQPTEFELEAYNQSLAKSEPVNDILAVHMGRSKFHLLQAMSDTFNVPFTIKIVELKKYERHDLSRMTREANFSCANAKYGFFVHTGNNPEFGLRLFDITVMEAKKTTKRLQEIFRSTEAGYFSANRNEWKIRIFDTPEEEDEKYYDGFVAVHPRVIAKAIKQSFDDPADRRHVGRKLFGDNKIGMIRLVGPWGTIKGRYVIDDNLDCDVKTHRSNMKAEVLYNSYSVLSIWPEDTWHTASYDSVSCVNLGKILKFKNQVRDLNHMVNCWTDELANGILPEWLHKGQPSHDEDGVPEWDERLSDDYGQVYVRWNAHIPARIGGVNAAANIVAMAANGLALEMLSGFKPVDDSDRDSEKVWKRMKVPMRNAANCPSWTWSALTKMAGFEFPDQDGSKLFYDARFGFVWPDDRFVETFDLHDGHDGDDHHSALAVKLWSSDPTITALYKQYGVLGKDYVVPTTKEEARIFAAMWRLPNGPGCYSFLEVDFESIPWHQLTDVEVIDLAKCPTPLPLLQAATPVIGFPAAHSMGSEMDRGKALRMVLTQRLNPGVGLFMNRITAIAYMNGGYLPSNLPATTSDMIDVVNQGGTAAQFRAIEAFVKSANEQIRHLGSQGFEIDENILMTRTSKSTREALRSSATTKTRYAIFAQLYAAAVQDLQEKVVKKTYETRSKTLLVRWVRQQELRTYRVWASQTEAMMTPSLHALDRAHNDAILQAGDNPFHKIAAQRAKSLALRAEIDRLLDEIYSLDNPGEAALTLWKHCVQIHGAMKNGISDRIIFQQGTTHAVMDLVLEELVQRGIAVRPAFEQDDAEYYDQD